MDAFVSWILAILAGLLAIPTVVFCGEIGVAAVVRRQVATRLSTTGRQRIAVLVPAHNESSVIALTLENIKTHLHWNDRLLVVADNCTDDTAEVVRKLGAEVVARHDHTRIGKGYALDWGLQHLDTDPPEIVVMIDADCLLEDGAIDRLVSACATTGRPAQALYLMTAPSGSQINHQVAEFAWRVRNWVRPLGLSGVGLPCQMMGTGMAFPWKLIRSAGLATGSIVEDLELGLELAAAGHPPLFCPSARITSQFAASARGASVQRRRWEHGHIITILKRAPRLMYAAVTCGNLNLLALTFDMAVPPLSLLAILSILMFGITGIAAVLGLGSTALTVSAPCLVGFVTAVVLAWLQYGRDVLPLRATLSVPKYIVAKVGLYLEALFGKTPERWIRTDRTKD